MRPRCPARTPLSCGQKPPGRQEGTAASIRTATATRRTRSCTCGPGRASRRTSGGRRRPLPSPTGGEPGRELVAFRTPECARHGSVVSAKCPEGGSDLNGDGDADDDVLQVYDRETGQIINTHQAVTPCRLEACDPRVPYRVGRDTVTFLTFEGDQGQ